MEAREWANGMRVGEVAAATGLTVRTLHHYKQIGLVVPTGRTGVGHRIYGPEELHRLYRVSMLRALGLSLAQVRESLDADPAQLRAVLTRHVAMVDERMTQAQRLRARLTGLVDRLDGQEAPTADLLAIVEDTVALQPVLERRISLLVYEDLEVAYDYLHPARPPVAVRGLGPDTRPVRRGLTRSLFRLRVGQRSPETRGVRGGLAGGVRGAGPEEPAQPIALGPRHDMDVQVRHGLADHVVHRHEGALGAERFRHRPGDGPGGAEQGTDEVVGQIAQGWDVLAREDQRVPPEQWPPVQEAHHVRGPYDQVGVGVGDQYAEDAAATRSRSTFSHDLMVPLRPERAQGARRTLFNPTVDFECGVGHTLINQLVEE